MATLGTLPSAVLICGFGAHHELSDIGSAFLFWSKRETGFLSDEDVSSLLFEIVKMLIACCNWFIQLHKSVVTCLTTTD
jgi:hypothetical protein